MPASPTMATDVAALLAQWLARQLAPDAVRWLEGEVARQRAETDERRLGIALGLAARRIGRAALALTADHLAAAVTLRAGWRPDTWAADEAARVALILATWQGDAAAFAARIERLCLTAELSEHVACLKGFAVFPAPDLILTRAREAARSSVQPHFEAIACHNPYPADHFDEAAFNQMVVKCVFSGIAIETVVGLGTRRNDELIRMMRDLVSERHAAGRTVPDAVHRWIGA